MGNPTRLMECVELQYILLGDLRDLLEEALDAESLKWLRAVLDALLETIPEQYDLKATDGYMQSVLDDFPNWHQQVEHLEEEQYTLFQQLRRLRLELDGGEHEAAARIVSLKLSQWMQNFKNHQTAERALVVMAANLEVGCGD